jgi:hypothetical protein
MKELTTWERSVDGDRMNKRDDDGRDALTIEQMRRKTVIALKDFHTLDRRLNFVRFMRIVIDIVSKVVHHVAMRSIINSQ